MIDRRRVITAIAARGSPVRGAIRLRTSRDEPDHRLRLFVSSLKGGDIRLADYAGKPLLVVNTASLCGFTPQYAGLEEVWSKFKDRGFVVIGVPSNDFGARAGRRERHRPHRRADLSRQLPDRVKDFRKGTERASLLQMGCERTAGRCSRLELPQIPRRPRRSHRGSILFAR
jgi:hypothetical protein